MEIRKKMCGSITIYLSLIMVVVMLFVSVVSEAARVCVVYSESKSFTYMAADSVLAGYARQIYDDYGVLLVWENQEVEEELKKYIQANINMADLSETGTNFMSTQLSGIEIEDIGYVTDKEGELFVSQIISYMKYAGGAEAANQLIQLFQKYEKGSEEKDESVTFMFDDKDFEEDNSELQVLVEDINEIIKDIKDIEKVKKLADTASQILENSEGDSKYNNKFIKTYRSLRKKLDKKAGLVSSAILLGKDYERKKAVYLKKSGYTSDVKDFIEENMIMLKNIGDKLEEEKALNVSSLSDIIPENINTARNSLNLIDEQINDIKSLKENQATEEDNKNKSIYENAKELLEKGILSLVIDDVSDVSNTSISNLNLPSNIKEQKNQINPIEKIKNKAFFTMYINRKFGSYTNQKKKHNLNYEMEYIINGKGSDKSNLTATVEKIVGIRNIMNVAYLITDKVKMEELTFISSSAATAIGIPFLEPIIKAILVEAWSLAESISDTKNLLQGNKIAFVKDKNSWNTDLKNLLGDSCQSESNKGKLCLDYEQYCQMLIMLMNSHDCIYRTMDLIQLNIQKEYNSGFIIGKCFQSIKFQGIYEAQPLFTSMPWVINLLNNNNGAYKYAVACEMKY